MQEQLSSCGYCVVDNDKGSDNLSDVAEVIAGWFARSSEQQKLCLANNAPSDMATQIGRGYFRMAAKEVLEIKGDLRSPVAPAELRLAANTACSTLQTAACDAVEAIFKDSSIVSGSSKQLKKLLGQQYASRKKASSTQGGSSSSNSVFHINRYTPSPAAAAANDCLLQGNEAHVDKGLVTVIWATQPGLQVLSRDGSWVPVTPGPHQLVILVGHTLSFLTAGRLPAAMHRVVVMSDSSDGGRQQSARLSLCFKLHAAPEAVLSPADVKPRKAEVLPSRYQVCKTVKQLMEEFDASHTSLHAQRSQQQQQQPAAAAAARVPGQRKPRSGHAGTATGAKRTSSDNMEPVSKHPCLQTVAASKQDDVTIKKEPVDKINISLRCAGNGYEAQFIVKSTTKFGNVFAVFCQSLLSKDILTAYERSLLTRQGPDHYYYSFHGGRVLSFCTPAELGLRNGDVIDAFPQLIGD